MTTIKNSTTDVLAAITAQNLFHRSPSQATAVTAAGVSENTLPVSSAEQKKETSQGDPEKNSRSRTSPDLKIRIESSPTGYKSASVRMAMTSRTCDWFLCHPVIHGLLVKGGP